MENSLEKNIEVINVQPVEDITLLDLPLEEQEKVRAYAQNIDVKNAAAVLQYGSSAQQKLTVFADEALQSVRTKDTGVVGETLVNLVGQLQGFSADSGKKGILGFFYKGASQIQALKTRYDNTSVSVEKVAGVLDNHRYQLLEDIKMLDRLYEQNLGFYRQLCFYILSGKEKIADLRENDYVALHTKAEETGDPADAQAVSDLSEAIDRFEKKVYDLELTRQVSLQMAPQIRLLQNNDSMMADKIHSALVNTLPLWKSQMVLALGLENARAAVAAQTAVTDATNRMLLQNAEVLKQGTIDTARASNRGIVDLDTLEKTNQALIDSLTEVQDIQRTGREQRAAAEGRLRQMEDALKQKLLEMRDRPYTSEKTT